MSDQDLSYFRLRAAEERQRAADAAEPNIRAIHLELAHRYDQAATATLEAMVPGSRVAIQASINLLRATRSQIGEL